MNTSIRLSLALLTCALLATASGFADAPPASSVLIENLDLSKMTCGWNSPRAGKSIEGNPITLHGQTYANGIGTHADSQLAIDLKGCALRFHAIVGIDDEVGTKGNARFEVWVDGRRQFKSGEMHGGDAPKTADVDLTGAKQMVMIVDAANDTIDFDHADWAGALLDLKPGATVQPVSMNAPVAPIIGAEPIFSYAKLDETPAIHGPKIVGTTPGYPFLFLIPATGTDPLKFEAKNLPAGLALDKTTGIISGSLKKDGSTVVTLTVHGPKGTAHRKFTIVGGTHKLALTPPLGWNSWNIFHGGVTGERVRIAADSMISSGLAAHGYAYVNVDDYWEGHRDASGVLNGSARFGDMKVLGDYIHSKGLKYGIYSSPGPKTCGRNDASYQFEQQDADSYAAWGVDYLKYDWCSYGEIVHPRDVADYQKPYVVMRNALDKEHRDIVYSLCQYGMGEVWKWAADPAVGVLGNCWRTTGDIGPSYSSMASIGFGQSDHAPYAGPGHWNDPDMLWLHPLQPNEQVTHMTLWSLLAAPLIIGSDLSKLSDYTRDVLSNDEVIDIDQDTLGSAATRRSSHDGLEVWARPLADGTVAVGLFNRTLEPATITAKWSDIGVTNSQPVRDLWLHKDLGKRDSEVAMEVPPHGAELLKVGKVERDE